VARSKRRPRPPRAALRSTVAPRTRHTTVGGRVPPPSPKASVPRSHTKRASPIRPPRVGSAGARQAGRIIDPDDSTLLDVIDNLLNKGVVLNADVILALADVDLVYLRVGALLCAADRVLPHAGR
jgi:gas vesicle protein GvpA/GvpJ/GvpM family